MKSLICPLTNDVFCQQGKVVLVTGSTLGLGTATEGACEGWRARDCQQPKSRRLGDIMNAILKILVTAILAAHLSLVWAQVDGGDTRIRIGSSMPLTGPLAANAKLFESGARLYFDRANDHGGVNGRKIAFEVLDDGFEPAKAAENCRTLVGRRNVLALFGNPGTAQVMAALPVISETGTPMFGPATGSPALRKQHVPQLFHVRASYRNELERIVDHAKTVGIQRIAIFHTEDALGKVVLEELTELLKKRNWPLAGIASTPIREGNMAAAAKELASHQPQAIVMGTVGANFAKFILAYKEQRLGSPQFYGFSLVDPGIIASELGPAGRGIVLTQIMPSVRNTTLQVVREYREALAKARPGAEPTVLELDAFVNAKIFVEGLRRAGKNPTRAGLTSALDSLGRYDAGGYAVTYTRENHNGSRFVDIAIVGANGRLMY